MCLLFRNSIYKLIIHEFSAIQLVIQWITNIVFLIYEIEIRMLGHLRNRSACNTKFCNYSQVASFREISIFENENINIYRFFTLRDSHVLGHWKNRSSVK